MPSADVIGHCVWLLFCHAGNAGAEEWAARLYVGAQRPTLQMS